MPVMTPEQELKHQQQARKGIQTSPDGKRIHFVFNQHLEIRKLSGFLIKPIERQK